MYSKNNPIVRNVFSFIVLTFMMLSCKEKETFKYYSFDFYPIEEVNNSETWIETDFLSGEKLAFQLNSLRILEEYHDFEPIEISTCNLFMDKSFIVNNDTIKAGENLLNELDNEMISFSQHIGEYGKEYNWYYLTIKSTDSKKINLPSNYYQFCIRGRTVGGYEFNDSILVKYNSPG